MTKNSIRQK